MFLSDIIGNVCYGLQWDEPLIRYIPPPWWQVIRKRRIEYNRRPR